MRRANSREEFIQEISHRGYHVRWEENRKHITYTTPTGMKCRGDKLHELKFRKEHMEHEFEIRAQAAQQCFGSPQAAGGTSHPDGITAQCAVHHAGADGGAAGHLRTAPAVVGADAGPQPGNPPVNGAHTLGHEGNNQTGWEAERRIYQRALIQAISSLRRWIPFIIMSLAAAAVPVCTLMRQTLTQQARCSACCPGWREIPITLSWVPPSGTVTETAKFWPGSSKKRLPWNISRMTMIRGNR